MKSRLLCPNCGHHIADFTTPSPPPGPGHYGNVDSSSVEAFLQARCRPEKGARVTTKAFREAYVEWCDENGETCLSAQAMGRVLAAMPHINSTASNGKRYYTGITFV